MKINHPYQARCYITEIKVISCYINPLADEVEKEQELFCKFVDYCKELGVAVIGTETGSVVNDLKDYELNLTEKNYERMKKCMEPLIAYANTNGIMVGVETVACYPICSSARFDRLTRDFKDADIPPFTTCARYITEVRPLLLPFRADIRLWKTAISTKISAATDFR